MIVGLWNSLVCILNLRHPGPVVVRVGHEERGEEQTVEDKGQVLWNVKRWGAKESHEGQDAQDVWDESH